MSDTLLGAMISLVAGAVGFTVSALVQWLLERQNRQFAHLDKRYESRLEACSALLAEADALDDKATANDIDVLMGAAQHPEDYAEPWDRLWPDLDRSYARVALVCGADCVAAAQALRSTVTGFAWSGGGAGKTPSAREAFVQAARADLGVDLKSTKPRG